MIELTAKSPFDGMLPLTVGALSLSEVDTGAMTALSARKGQGEALASAFKQAHGVAWPRAGRATGREGCRALWFGHVHVLLMGPPAAPALAEWAALVDQSDAWAVARLEGAGVRDVLARLTPLDLREGQFKRGRTARSEVAHMPASITRIGAQSYQVMVFRAMAGTLVEEVQTAMQGVAARAGG
ncbi:sarcosine oxidase subunit gamma [Sediminimonas qiaohouensis]|uniref:sarcosine oxidase subunit gamma n=1 Tax=Sediminimonas qiaohouensis TaxID=552061 RepID=UPI0003FDD9CF|nr:sarcosine oxidase subunit gamma [Sediminimonas qiaohouensis]